MQSSSETKATKDIQLSVRETLSSKNKVGQKDSEAEFSNSSDDDDDEANFDARMRQRIHRKRRELGDIPSKQRQNGTVFIFITLLSVCTNS